METSHEVPSPQDPRNLHGVAIQLAFCGHLSSGSMLQMNRDSPEAMTRMRKTAFPPIQLYSCESAKSDVDVAGPMARRTEATT